MQLYCKKAVVSCKICLSVSSGRLRFRRRDLPNDSVVKWERSNGTIVMIMANGDRQWMSCGGALITCPLYGSKSKRKKRNLSAADAARCNTWSECFRPYVAIASVDEMSTLRPMTEEASRPWNCPLRHRRGGKIQFDTRVPSNNEALQIVNVRDFREVQYRKWWRQNFYVYYLNISRIIAIL